MKTEITFKPYKKQFQALQVLRDNHTNEVLYWWWARWAKSYLGCAWCIINAYSMPWSAWLIGRNELKRLKATTLITFYEVSNSFGLKQWQDFNYNAQDSIITFKNGSIIFLIDLSYMPSDPNYDRLGSYGITYAFIDEAQEINEQAISILKGRYSKLSGEGWNTIPKALYTCNPAKNWIYREFYLPYKNWSIRDDRAFIPSLVTDNPSIAPEYIENLKKADNVTVQRLLYGNFDYDDTPWRLFSYDDLINLWTNPLKWWDWYLSIDVARKWRDKTIVYRWEGLDIVEVIQEQVSDMNTLSERIKWLAREHSIDRLRIVADEDWVGWWLVDNLKCQWFINNATPRQSKKANLSTRRNFQNLKTQCYFELARQIKNISIRDESIREKLIEELDVIVQTKLDSDTKISIIPKEEIKEKIWRSPDFSDAMMMRMIYELGKTEEEKEEEEKNKYDHEMDEEIFGRDEIVIDFDESDSAY